MRVETHSAQDTQALAASLAPVLPAGTWIRLEGDLGAGKTTFTQGLGMASYRQQGDLVLVEWAQFIETELPTAYLDLALSYGQEVDDRVLTVQWVGGQEPEWLSQWSKEVSDHAR